MHGALHMHAPDIVLAQHGHDNLARVCVGLGDLARMLWSSVDLDDGVIRFTQGKTKRRLAVPIHPEQFFFKQ